MAIMIENFSTFPIIFLDHDSIASKSENTLVEHNVSIYLAVELLSKVGGM